MTSTAVVALPDVIRWIACWMLVDVSLEGWPPVDLESDEQCLEWSLEIVEWFKPVDLAIWWVDCPASSRERIWECWVELTGCMGDL